MTHDPFDPADGSGPDQPDRRWPAAAGHVDPADPHLLDRLGIVIPDDARALDADRHALLGAGPGSRAGRLVRHLVITRRVWAPSATAVLAALLVTVVAVSASLVSLLSPRMPVQRRTDTVALASAPVATPGVIGGLLPEAGVLVDGTRGTSARDLRPAVLLHPSTGAGPGGCAACADQLSTLWRQAREYGIGVYVVVPPDAVDEATRLAADATQGAAHVVADSSGSLTAAYGDRATTRAVLVHADGVVGDVIDEPATNGRFEQVLSPLRYAGAPPSLRPAPGAPGT